MPINIAFYVTSHGLGHITRALAICENLLQQQHHVTIVTGAPHAETLLADIPTIHHRAKALDSSSLQADAFTVDTLGSLRLYTSTIHEQRDALLHQEVAWLQEAGVDIVLSDIVPLACTAAARAGIPALCISNFSWDFIYSEYLASAGRHQRNIVWQIAQDYAHATALLRLPGHCPMPAFPHIVDVPMVVRPPRKGKHEVFHSLGLDPHTHHLVLLMYGGHHAGSLHLSTDNLPPGWVCVVCGGGQPPAVPLPKGFIMAACDAYTPDLVAAADCVLGKIGYGTTSECLVNATPLVYVRRDFFNEEPFLRRLLEFHCAGIEMKRRDFLSGNWQPCLLRASQVSVQYQGPVNGAEEVVSIVQQVAAGTYNFTQADAQAGATRLRDTVVWGYVMQRHGNHDVDVPSWYTQDALPSPTTQQDTSPMPDTDITGHENTTDENTTDEQKKTQRSKANTPATPVHISDKAHMPAKIHITQGKWDETHVASMFPDTVNFLTELVSLDAAVGDGDPPERRAARGMFRWEDDIIVTRAPGRLDLMGGIADFSGSLVLQMPLALAAHAALQLHSVEQQPTWRHVQARHASTGTCPALRLVSLHSDKTNRTPTFDMDLCDLLDAHGGPLEYDAAHALFHTDPSHRWVAYIVGALVVLQRECHVDVQSHGMSLLISSAVPEGKGVSSSAAVEVASMAAVAAAYGVQLEGRAMALLCQKVENLVVGAPCGVMDQMTSVLGEQHKLLALLCQPAEIQGQVSLPGHLQVWGLDSGIQHSVAGADYGTVRAATFMGRHIIMETNNQCTSAQHCDTSAQHSDTQTNAKAAEAMQNDTTAAIQQNDATAALQATQNSNTAAAAAAQQLYIDHTTTQTIEYLACMSVSDFRTNHMSTLPHTATGAVYVQQHGPTHGDAVTRIIPDRQYSIRDAAAHPVEECFRARVFRQLLQHGAHDIETRQLLGELMFQSHESYGRLGLGSEGTDLLVNLVKHSQAQCRAEGRDPVLYGARITGGGCGGTVVVLGECSPAGDAAIAHVIEGYRAAVGYTPLVFKGSSHGAHVFGALSVRKVDK